MRTDELFLDPRHPGVVHASATCEHNLGLLFDIESSAGPVDFVDELIAAASDLGLTIPAWQARHHTPCEHCCLVVTSSWAIAA